MVRVRLRFLFTWQLDTKYDEMTCGVMYAVHIRESTASVQG